MMKKSRHFEVPVFFMIHPEVPRGISDEEVFLGLMKKSY